MEIWSQLFHDIIIFPGLSKWTFLNLGGFVLTPRNTPLAFPQIHAWHNKVSYITNTASYDLKAYCRLNITCSDYWLVGVYNFREIAPTFSTIKCFDTWRTSIRERFSRFWNLLCLQVCCMIPKKINNICICLVWNFYSLYIYLFC